MDQPVELSRRDERFMKIFSVVAGVLLGAMAIWIFTDIMIMNVKSW